MAPQAPFVTLLKNIFNLTVTNLAQSLLIIEVSSMFKQCQLGRSDHDYYPHI